MSMTNKSTKGTTTHPHQQIGIRHKGKRKTDGCGHEARGRPLAHMAHHGASMHGVGMHGYAMPAGDTGGGDEGGDMGDEGGDAGGEE